MHSKIVWLIVGSIVFGGGYYFGKQGHNPPTSEGLTHTAPDLMAKFRSLTENEISEYYELKTMEERYRKADDILAKIMTIFVADLGLRLTDQAQAASKTEVERPQAPVCPVCPQIVAAKAPTKNSKSNVEPTNSIGNRAAVTQEELEQLRRPKQIDDFLNNNKLEDPNQTISATKSFSNPPSVFFQLYYLKSSDRFIGNVYSRNDAESMVYIGTINLQRN